MRSWFPKIIMFFFFAMVLCSCAGVKSYQRAYLNDREMQLNTRATVQFEDYYQSIREGSTIPVSGKTSDGCGCK